MAPNVGLESRSSLVLRLSLLLSTPHGIKSIPAWASNAKRRRRKYVPYGHEPEYVLCLTEFIFTAL